MPTRDLIVIGASAGGVEALKQLVTTLPVDLQAAVFIVLHISPHATSVLPAIITRAGNLLATHPKDGDHFERGHIYIAPPNHHLIIKPHHIKLTQGPKENGHRPSVDVLFRTAARVYRNRVIALVLSGALDDGSAGILKIKDKGGVAIAQNPDEALYRGMPENAIATGKVDYIASINEIAPLLVRLMQEPIAEENTDMSDEPDVAELDANGRLIHELGGTASTYSCPDCGGVLMEYKDDGFVRFRCQVGHAYSAETMLAEQNDAIEEALWVALRTLEENATLSRRMADRAQTNGYADMHARYMERIQDIESRAALLRHVLLNDKQSRR
jgi:two-component system, chemotaxis family, protein-glutamate methylesterase/glutaminase